jgi:thymidylate synthase ThyX
MANFTPEEKARLAPYVTDTDADVFAIKGLDGIVGAVYARYSRASTGFRETLLKEFVDEGNLDAAKAADLIERVLIAYGDDSVGELEGGHLSFENISILATKEIEDRRIGGSPIEKSTRYVFYDQKGPDGNYLYYRDPAIMASEHAAAYTATMDQLFDTYARLVEPMQEYYKQLKPLESAEYDINGDGAKEKWTDLTEAADQKAFRRTYKMDIRTKACDSLRYLLPLSTLTNVGLFGNGRFFQGLISWLWTTDLPEANRLGTAAKEQLDRIIPRYVKRASQNEYLENVRTEMQTLTDRLTAGHTAQEADRINLIDRDEIELADQLSGRELTAAHLKEALNRTETDRLLASMLYPYANLPFGQLRRLVQHLDEANREAVTKTYINERRTRRDRPGRAFESGYDWTFDCLTDFGTYKDIMRHRMTTQMRQRFTPLLGFEMPADIEAAGYADEVNEAVAAAQELYRQLAPDFPAAASYATLHGSQVRWLIGMNDREASHLLELRTIPQGHDSYRRACQEMHRQMADRSPWRAEALKFVDHNQYYWSRADSEAKQRVKEKALKEKRAA